MGIDVTGVYGAHELAGMRGHGYWVANQRVSSDVLLSMVYPFDPAWRGLVHAPGRGMWTFPDDYPQRVGDALYAKAPSLPSPVTRGRGFSSVTAAIEGGRVAGLAPSHERRPDTMSRVKVGVLRVRRRGPVLLAGICLLAGCGGAALSIPRPTDALLPAPAPPLWSRPS